MINVSVKFNLKKKVKFWNLSDVLIFSIKTFRLNKKIEKHIDFPEELDMSDYCINNKGNLKYKLSGICIHGGKSTWRTLLCHV